jgi:hypothetical protein
VWPDGPGTIEYSRKIAFDPIYRKHGVTREANPGANATLNKQSNTMKKQTKSVKNQPRPTSTGATTFGKWLRSIPTRSDGKVTLQPPVRLTPSQWAILTVDAARRGISLDESLQRSINTFVDMIQEDLPKAA